MVFCIFILYFDPYTYFYIFLSNDKMLFIAFHHKYLLQTTYIRLTRMGKTRIGWFGFMSSRARVACHIVVWTLKHFKHKENFEHSDFRYIILLNMIIFSININEFKTISKHDLFSCPLSIWEWYGDSYRSVLVVNLILITAYTILIDEIRCAERVTYTHTRTHARGV